MLNKQKENRREKERKIERDFQNSGYRSNIVRVSHYFEKMLHIRYLFSLLPHWPSSSSTASRRRKIAKGTHYYVVVISFYQHHCSCYNIFILFSHIFYRMIILYRSFFVHTLRSHVQVHSFSFISFLFSFPLFYSFLLIDTIEQKK